MKLPSGSLAGGAEREEATVQRCGSPPPPHSREAYGLHQDAARTGLGVVAVEPFKCPDCPLTFGQEKMLQGHMIFSSSKCRCKIFSKKLNLCANHSDKRSSKVNILIWCSYLEFLVLHPENVLGMVYTHLYLGLRQGLGPNNARVWLAILMPNALHQ
jgi:hypothetical protein